MHIAHSICLFGIGVGCQIWWRIQTCTQWYILKSRILLLIWVHVWACILLLKVIYRFFGAHILLWKYIRAQNWTQLAQSRILDFKMYHWVCLGIPWHENTVLNTESDTWQLFVDVSLWLFACCLFCCCKKNIVKKIPKYVITTYT